MSALVLAVFLFSAFAAASGIWQIAFWIRDGLNSMIRAMEAIDEHLTRLEGKSRTEIGDSHAEIGDTEIGDSH